MINLNTLDIKTFEPSSSWLEASKFITTCVGGVNSTERKQKEEKKERKAPAWLTVKRILKSGNRTIVFWADGEKTMVKRADDEPDNDYAAFTAALGIRLYGSNSALKRVVKTTETQKPKKAKLAEAEAMRFVEELKEGNRAAYAGSTSYTCAGESDSCPIEFK